MKALFKQISQELKHQKSYLLGQPQQDQPEDADPNVIQANEHKEMGNQCLSGGFYDEAIMYYTKSIAFYPKQAMVFANRATAFKHKQEFQLMAEDSEQAIKIDSQYFKGYLRHGEASVELGKMPSCKTIDPIARGLESLMVAQSLVWNLPRNSPAFKHKDYLGQEISNQILRAKKIKWHKEQILKKEELENLLRELQQHLHVSNDDTSEQVLSATPTGEEDDVQVFSADQVKRTVSKKLYEKVEKELKASDVNVSQLEVPDYLLCRITDELMNEPVTLESGFTYEKSAIQKHFETNGNFDPMTREEVNVAVLLPNKSIKYASQDFLLNNPWAFERIYGETIDQIKM